MSERFKVSGNYEVRCYLMEVVKCLKELITVGSMTFCYNCASIDLSLIIREASICILLCLI